MFMVKFKFEISSNICKMILEIVFFGIGMSWYWQKGDHVSMQKQLSKLKQKSIFKKYGTAIFERLWNVISKHILL